LESLETGDDSDEIGDLEDELMSDYDYLKDVEIDDISLDGDEDDIDVRIEVDLDDNDDDWEDLSDRDIKNWIKDLVNSIQDELSDDTNVNGKIVDTDSGDVLVKFKKDGDDSLSVTFKDKDYRGSSSDSDVEDVEDSLEGDSFYVGSIEFSITDIDYDDDDSVTIVFGAANDGAVSDWNDLSSSIIKNRVQDICEEIAGIFEDEADVSLATVIVEFYDENLDYLLDSFEYDVDDKDLD